ncbi:hypothetical protein B7R77_20415 [Ralstonia solanacearum K60]|uniref:Uncharacterized protein n=1 Tax=Ralstonia solanacearum K60 TaxID=1091042 RepID=A0AAP7ZKB9_RALSL|nr:hypothetical protein B7R77_20415 [Ralstonia solanacearum K60]
MRNVCSHPRGTFRRKRDEQLGISTPAPTDQPHDKHRVIADAWLRRVIDGIRQMHLDKDVRREVAGRIF